VSAGVASWRVIMPGGTVRPGSTMLAGNPGEEFFSTVHADLCFVGALAVTGSMLTDATLEVAAIKRAMMKSARRRVLLVDSTKFRPPGFSSFGDLSEIDEVITDEGIRPDHLASLKSLDVRVTVVEAVAPKPEALAPRRHEG
jgi:DeoR/GlpR family transcriptional regulator of sugar metabolism